MTEDESELLDGLRQLAADRQQAPSCVEERLLAAFERHHRKRRLLLWLPAGSIAAAAAAVLLFGLHPAQFHPAPAAALVASAGAADEDTEGVFYPLPEAEALPPVENALVVRVEVPVSSLRLMGVPVSEDNASANVQADVLLGQDGLARGVRLVE